MATEYVDYLILGDEHHGEIHRDINKVENTSAEKLAAVLPKRPGNATRPVR